MVSPAQIAAVLWERDSASQEAGIHIEDVGEGAARLSMQVRPDMVNGHGVCHGAYVFLLADSAMAYASNSHNRVTMASGAGIDFVASARLGERLIANAKQEWLGGRTAVTDVVVTGDDGRRVALFRGRTTVVGGAVVTTSSDDGPTPQQPQRMRVDDLVAEARAQLRRLTPFDTASAMAAGAVLIDVRMSADRRADGVVPESIHIPRTVVEWWCDPDWEWRDPIVADTGRQLIVMCNHGLSSSLAAHNLRRIGLDATDVDGGFEAWKAAGLPVADEDGLSTRTDLGSYADRAGEA